MGLGKASFIEKCPLYTTFLFLRGGGNKGGHKPKLMFIISRGTMNEICVGESNIYWEGGGRHMPHSYTYVLYSEYMYPQQRMNILNEYVYKPPNKIKLQILCR